MDKINYSTSSGTGSKKQTQETNKKSQDSADQKDKGSNSKKSEDEIKVDQQDKVDEPKPEST